jgi:uncharacterized protein YjbI with pentapeptide repeats
MTCLEPKKDADHFLVIRNALEKRGLRVSREGGWEVHGPQGNDLSYPVYVGYATWPDKESVCVAVYPWGVWEIDGIGDWKRREAKRRVTIAGGPRAGGHRDPSRCNEKALTAEGEPAPAATSATQDDGALPEDQESTIERNRAQEEADQGEYRVPLEVYDQLERATPDERVDIVLRLIEEHQKHRLELPERDGRSACLDHVNLSSSMLRARLEKLGFDSATWWDTDLEGANLRMARLQGANLQDAYLQGANLGMAELQGANLWDANLEGACLLSAKLRGAGLEGANLQGANLGIAHLQGAKLQGANLQGANLWSANLHGADLHGARLNGVDLSTCDLTHIWISGAWLDRTRLRWEQLGAWFIERLFGLYPADRTRLRWEQLGAAIGEELAAADRKLSAYERAGIYGEAKRGYLGLKQNFDDLGDYDAASRAYRKERRMEKWEAYQGARAALGERKLWTALSRSGQCAGALFVELLCDYGESVSRVIAWMIALILGVGPALVAALGGLIWTGDNQAVYQSLNIPWQRGLYAYGQYVLYILDAFTTASFAELKPWNDYVRLASGLIAVSGIVLAGLLGFVAGNRIRKS